MSVKRRDLIRYFEKNNYYLLREGSKHSIYSEILMPCYGLGIIVY